jgi:hypothetical protein
MDFKNGLISFKEKRPRFDAPIVDLTKEINLMFNCFLNLKKTMQSVGRSTQRKFENLTFLGLSTLILLT